MSFTVNCITLRGQSHVQKNIVCQDTSGFVRIGKSVVAVVADGHGGDQHFRSDRGSKFAVSISLKIIGDFLKNKNINSMLEDRVTTEKHIHLLLESISDNWREAVSKDLQAENLTREQMEIMDSDDAATAYGTTLLIVCATPMTSFSIRIGDGKIASIDKDYNLIFDDSDKDNKIGTFTKSLSDPEKIRGLIEVYDKSTVAFAVFSDGLVDAYHKDQLSTYVSGMISLSSSRDYWYGAIAEQISDCSKRKPSEDDVSLAIIVNSNCDVDTLYQNTFGSDSPRIKELPSCVEPILKIRNGGHFDENGNLIEYGYWSTDLKNEYQGCFLNGTPQYAIKGKYRYRDCFVGFDLSGFGKKELLSTNQLLYEGNFKNGLEHGKGVEYTYEGQTRFEKYDGYFKKGKYCGKGTLFQHYNSESVPFRKGNFENGELNDKKGKEFYKSGPEKYVGEYKNGILNGKASFYMLDESKNESFLKYSGTYENGELIDGSEFDKNKNIIYCGQFKNRKYDGEGTKYIPNHLEIYSGKFKDGVYDGWGIEYTYLDGKKVVAYEGYFTEGKPSSKEQCEKKNNDGKLDPDFVQDYNKITCLIQTCNLKEELENKKELLKKVTDSCGKTMADILKNVLERFAYKSLINTEPRKLLKIMDGKVWEINHKYDYSREESIKLAGLLGMIYDILNNKPIFKEYYSIR